MLDNHKSIGIRLTPQRLAILDILKDNVTHPSAEDIYREAKKRFPTMSFATVYNTLEVLRERGAIQALNIDGERMRYDPNPEQHNHLRCTGCKRITDIAADIPVNLPPLLAAGFDIKGSHTEFYGICPECREKE